MRLLLLTLFSYINQNADRFHTKIHFSTLSEYFDAIKKEKGLIHELLFNTNILEYPKLQGDFFTYADRVQDYWSGYYVSRPYWKRKVMTSFKNFI